MTGVAAFHPVAVRPFEAAAFAPYGAIVECPGAGDDRSFYSDWLAPVEGLQLQFHVNKVRASRLPLQVDRMERHPHAAQVFLPLDVSRYLVTVMPADAGGAPDPLRALCMEMPGTLGVIYRKGAWHAGATVLDRDGCFAVLMHRGARDDDVFAPVAPLQIRASDDRPS